MELPGQKGFYDTRRQFQGHDSPRDPRADETESPLPSSAPPRGQLIVGGIFLLLIVLAFFKFALPAKLVGLGGPTAEKAIPAAPAPTAH